MIDSNTPLDVLVETHGQIIKELKKRGIIKNVRRSIVDKSAVREIGESLAIHIYTCDKLLPTLLPLEKRRRDFNAISTEGDRYAIKILPSKKHKLVSGLFPLDFEVPPKGKMFDYLIVCLFDGDCRLDAVYEFSWQTVQNHMTCNETRRSWRMEISKTVLSNAKIIVKPTK
jgi:hypothetical protein